VSWRNTSGFVSPVFQTFFLLVHPTVHVDLLVRRLKRQSLNFSVSRDFKPLIINLFSSSLERF
jgi:hypothetical protein